MLLFLCKLLFLYSVLLRPVYMLLKGVSGAHAWVSVLSFPSFSSHSYFLIFLVLLRGY